MPESFAKYKGGVPLNNYIINHTMKIKTIVITIIQVDIMNLHCSLYKLSQVCMYIMQALDTTVDKKVMSSIVWSAL